MTATEHGRDRGRDGPAANTRSALVTGASSGIGRSVALRLDAIGFRVFAGVRRQEDAEALAEAGSPSLEPVFLDVTEDASIRQAVETVRERLGRAGLDGLVNNAGIAVGGPLEFLPLPDLRRQLEVNVIGQVAVTQACLPLLRRARGRIVNMGSIAGRSALPMVGAYSASKFALEAVTDALRLELRPWGIDVSIVEPGAVATAIWSRSLAAAEALAERLPERAHELYGPLMRAVRRRAQGAAARGVPPDRVARVVAHALTARRPRTRYRVGRDARLRIWLERLPDRLRDRIVASRLRRALRAAREE